MKVLLYSEYMKQIGRSGLGKAIHHQQVALERNGIEYTTDPHDTYDLMHINTYFAKSYYLAKRAHHQGKPVVFHAHSTEEDFRNSFRFSNELAPLFKHWLIQAYREGDCLITPTPYAQRILETYPIDREIFVISNGIDLNKFKTIPYARQQLIRKYGFYDEDFIVMGVGLYLERKGILDFIALAERLPHIQFIWFGYTNPKLIPDKIRHAIATELPNLTFAGYVPNEEIILSMQGANLFLFPTHEETEGIPAVEACAAKIPFIVRDIPVFDDWLIDRVHTYKAADQDQFADLIQQMAARKLPSLVDTAYTVAQERDLTQIGQQLIQVYDHALSLHASR